MYLANEPLTVCPRGQSCNRRNPIASGAAASGLPGSASGSGTRLYTPGATSFDAAAMEERREVLDLASAGAELELAASVERDPPLPARVVEVEQPAEAAEAGRLRVQRLRREGQRVDVGDGVDHRVPADPGTVRLEHFALLRIGEVGVLDPGLRQRLDDEAVQLGARRTLGLAPGVRLLEVDHVYAVELGEVSNQGFVPVARRIELEPKAGLAIAQPAQAIGAVGRRGRSRRRSSPAPANGPAPRAAAGRPGGERGRAQHSRTPSGDSRAARRSARTASRGCERRPDRASGPPPGTAPGPRRHT